MRTDQHAPTPHGPIARAPSAGSLTARKQITRKGSPRPAAAYRVIRNPANGPT